MKNAFMLIMLIMVIAGCSTKPDVAIINFKNPTIDIGHIKANSRPVNVTFTFANNGGKDLQVNNVASDCSCTAFSFTEKNIAPGDSGTINVKLNPKAIFATGNFERQMVVHSNTKPRLHTLIIKMFVDR